jgi:hypothetical protein
MLKALAAPQAESVVASRLWGMPMVVASAVVFVCGTGCKGLKEADLPPDVGVAQGILYDAGSGPGERHLGTPGRSEAGSTVHGDAASPDVDDAAVGRAPSDRIEDRHSGDDSAADARADAFSGDRVPATNPTGPCSSGQPDNYGKPCGMCGGTIQCDGSCSRATPATYGNACGRCGGTVLCDNSCSKSTPVNLGQPCGDCGGTIQCDTFCSKPNPPAYNASCGMCGGRIRCDGSCSAATPPDFGQRVVDSYEVSATVTSSSPPGSNQGTRVVGFPCPSGWASVAHEASARAGDPGSCQILMATNCVAEIQYLVNFPQSSDPPNTLVCQVRVTRERRCD